MTDVSDQISAAKETITDPLPHPRREAGKRAEPKELLDRLKWGEPALTIIDVRDRESFNKERIMGAMPMPLGQIPQSEEPLFEYSRDIYVYGDSDEMTAEGANQFRQAGFQNVAEIIGGLPAWKDLGGPTEGSEAFSSPIKDARNS